MYGIFTYIYQTNQPYSTILQSSRGSQKMGIQKKSMDSAMLRDALKPLRIGFPNLRWFRWMRARRTSVENFSGRIESLKTWMTQGTFLGMNLFQVLVTFYVPTTKHYV